MLVYGSCLKETSENFVRFLKNKMDSITGTFFCDLDMQPFKLQPRALPSTTLPLSYHKSTPTSVSQQLLLVSPGQDGSAMLSPSSLPLYLPLTHTVRVRLRACSAPLCPRDQAQSPDVCFVTASDPSSVKAQGVSCWFGLKYNHSF